MTVLTDLVTALEADAGVSAAVGSRIYPAPAPNTATMPYLVYQEISVVPVGTGAPRCEEARVQLDGYAESYATMKGIRDALVSFAVDQGRRYVVASDLSEFEGDRVVYHQPVDVFIL